MKTKNNTTFTISRARYNLLFMIFLSIINVYFVLAQGVIKIPFSSSLSTYSAVFSKAVANQSGDESFCRVGILLAGVILCVYFACYLLSKKKPLFLFVSFVIFIFDTVFLIAITIILSQLNILTIFDIILHAITLFMLFSAVKSSRKNPKTTEENHNIIDDENEYEEITEVYDNNGSEPIISACINDLDIKVYFEEDKAKMVVNNFVCAEKQFDVDSYFELYAIINDVELSFISRKGKEYILYGNKELLNSVVNN